jgi:uncharacterized protein YecE (DUF72 family)
MSQGTVRVGTSGWHYDHWKGPFYPEKVGEGEMLERYVEHFDTAEINNSFYQLPSRETLERWRDTTPAGFVFSAKASRYMTHMKKLKDPREPLSRFYDRLEVLGDKLGPILFQLPPRWNKNLERLDSFLGVLSTDHRHAFEFRDPSWLDDETFELLGRYDAAHCIYDLAGRQSPTTRTSDLVYVRLHGPGRKYEGSYDEGALSDWAQAFRKWSGDGSTVYCYFDNDQDGHAPRNARRLNEMIDP